MGTVTTIMTIKVHGPRKSSFNVICTFQYTTCANDTLKYCAVDYKSVFNLPQDHAFFDLSHINPVLRNEHYTILSFNDKHIMLGELGLPMGFDDFGLEDLESH
jgi:hypothetical protein